MAKFVAARPDWLKAANVDDIYSVSGCLSGEFADYISDWRHNGFWLFDSPSIIAELAREHAVDLAGTTMFYFEAYEKQYDDGMKQWTDYDAERDFPLRVVPPQNARLEGFDVVTFSARTAPECSPLSCNGLAAEIAVNAHCLLDSLETAIQLIEAGRFDNSEPGPFRLFSVHTL